MKALIFGSFNPVTNAHINMGKVAWNTLGPDCEVIYIPTSDAYIKNWKGYKEGSVLPAEIRVKLLLDATRKCGFPASVSTVEIDGITDGKTYNTMKYFGFDESVLCLGIDNIFQMKRWFAWQDLLQYGQLLIFRRDGYQKTDEVMDILRHAPRYKWANYINQSSISSTEVRNCYVKGNMKKLKTMVPKNVFDYLEGNKHVYF